MQFYLLGRCLWRLIVAGGFNIDAAAVMPTTKSKAIIAVNSFGAPFDINTLKETGLPVIEDCSHGYAVDRNWVARPLQSDIAIFSFYATKLIAGGEGGAIVSNNSDYLHFCRDWRDYTDKAPDPQRLNDKMTDIEAALISMQLEKLCERLAAREKAVQFYDENLDLPILKKPDISGQRIWYRYCLSISQNLIETINILDQQGIATRIPVVNWLGTAIETFPNAKKAYSSTLSLPLYPAITKKELNSVCETVKRYLGHD